MSGKTTTSNAHPRGDALVDERDGAQLQSPLTSVKHLLADTAAAPPPDVRTAPPAIPRIQQQQQQHQFSSIDASQEGGSKSASANGSGSGSKRQKGVSFAQVVKEGEGLRDGTQNNESSNSNSSEHSLSDVPPQQQTGTSAGTGKPTLQQTLADLRTFLLPFLKLLPFQSSIHGVLKRLVGPLVRFLVRMLAVILHRGEFGLASNIGYDCHVLFWRWVINLFFREIRPRGAWKVPRSGPVLLVCGPHHNQFLDPLLLQTEVRLSANRRVSFLIAEKSYYRPFIGLASRIAHSIPVARAADNATPGKGRIYLTRSSSDECLLKGRKTAFSSELAPKSQVQLLKPYGFAVVEVVEVLDDETVRVKKMFGKDKAVNDLLEEGRKLENAHGDGEDGEVGLQYKCLPYIDQTKMYSSVYKKLSEGGGIGIFPEGGSHDRTDFLPLKHGLAIMALGAMAANPDLQVKIVPVGLNYFHPHRFRSRAVIEFGSPISIPPELVATFAKGGPEKRAAVGSIMELVHDGLKSVTVRAPDYDTLMVIQASRRLYKPPGQQLNLSQVVELNKRFIMGYNTYRDEPRVKELYKQVVAYNTALRRLGLKDHQVEGANRPRWKSALLLLWRTGLISAWTLLALPGIIMNAPIFIAASIISAKKAREALAASTVKLQGRDVLATWKVLVSLGMAPVLYALYTVIAMYCVFRYNLGRKYLFLTPLFMVVAVPSFGYSALRFGEVGMDIYKSLPPLFMSLFPSHYQQIERLRTRRREVSEELTSVIEEFAPKLWADFESRRIVPNSDFSHAYSSTAESGPGTPTGLSRKRRNTFGPESSILSHPMTWIDEKLFGWSSSSSSSSRRGRQASEGGSSGGFGQGEYTPTASEPVTPGYRTESEDDPADYDEVVRAVEQRLSDNLAATGGGGGGTAPPPLRRKACRTRSQLNLTEVHPDNGGGSGVATAQATGVQPSTTKVDQRAPHDSYADAVKDE